MAFNNHNSCEVPKHRSKATRACNKATWTTLHNTHKVHTQSSEGNSKCNQTMQTIQHNQTFFFLYQIKKCIYFSLPYLDETDFWVFGWILLWRTHKPNWSRAGGIPETDRRWHRRSCWGGMWPCSSRVMWLWSLGSEPKRHVWASHILMFLSPLSTTHSFSLPNPPAIVQNSP